MKSKINHILVCVCIAFCAAGAYAQQPDALVDRKEIRIGEQAQITLSVAVPKANMPLVSFPSIGDTIVNGVEVLRRSSIDTLATGKDVKETRLEQRVTITSFDTGYYAIPPFTFEIDGNRVSTRAFLFTVTGVEVDTTKGIHDIRDIYEVSLGWRDYVSEYWPYAAGAAAVLAAIIAAILVYRRMRERASARPKVEEPVVRKAPHLLAIEALERIRQERLYANDKAKQYYTEITDALRDYIEAVFDMPAHELTSAQILSRLRYADLPKGEMQKLRSLLNLADMVKFAKEKPDAALSDKSAVDAIAFVNNVQAHLGAQAESDELNKGGAPA